MDSIQIIQQVGFPIFCVIALGYFIYKSYENISKENSVREEKLYTMLGKSQEQLDRLEDTNAGFLKVLEQFQKDQEDIRHDIEDIKDDIKSIPKRATDFGCSGNCKSKSKKEEEKKDE